MILFLENVFYTLIAKFSGKKNQKIFDFFEKKIRKYTKRFFLEKKFSSF